jgi:hypothetical protein
MDRCPDCGTAPGKLHVAGCEVERCPACGGQAIGCGYCGADHGPSDRVPWTREWPGVDECRAFGWYARRVPDVAGWVPWTREWPGVDECRAFGWYARRVPDVAGWVPCEAREEGAREDLNRLHMGEAVWSRAVQRYVRLQ